VRREVVAGTGLATYLHGCRAGRKRSKARCCCAQHAPHQQPLQRSCGRPLAPKRTPVSRRFLTAARCRALHVL
jgi:hypothetical protein